MREKFIKYFNDKSLGFILLVPSTVLLLIVSIIPFLNAFRLAMMDYNVLRPGTEKFIFLENIKNIITTDSEFYSTLSFTFFYTFFVVLLSYLAGLLFSLLLNRDIKYKGLFRAFILAPWVVPSAVAATNWIWILNDQIGFINNILQSIGIINSPILFLGSKQIAKYTVIFTSAWKSFPFMTIVLLAGLSSIPSNLYEAAKIDGANIWQTFKYITFPLLKNVSLICTTLMFIWTFNNFGNIYLLTQGGPGKATFTLSILTYYTAFFRGNIGYASAIAVIMSILLLIISIFYLRLNEEEN